MIQGVYAAQFKLQKTKKIEIGALGTRKFGKGSYVYIGSAQSGAEKRIERHFSEQKNRYWHIDYFSKEATPQRAIALELPKAYECAVSKAVEGHKVNGFGASDCSCSAHLTKLP